MTSDTGASIRFHAHKRLAQSEFESAGVLSRAQFEKVDWDIVHDALTAVPRLFQVWACKQVWGIAGTNRELSRWSDVSPLCPSCLQTPETCGHILTCPHAGRVSALQSTIKLMDKWMKRHGTDPDLRDCIYEYCMGRGGILMADICEENGYDEGYIQMARAQDTIGWRRFLEGMVCKEMRLIQRAHCTYAGKRDDTATWGRELVTRLLEVAHGQWLYRMSKCTTELQGH